MKKEDVLGELDGNNSTCWQMLMNAAKRPKKPLTLPMLSFNDHNLRNVKLLKEDCKIDYVLTESPAVPVHLFAIRDGVALALNEQHIFLPLGQKALASVLSAIIALSKTNKKLLAQEENGMEFLKSRLFSPYVWRGLEESNSEKVNSIEKKYPASIERQWNPKIIVDFFGGSVTEGMVRKCVRDLAARPCADREANFPKGEPGATLTWNRSQMIRLVDYMRIHCPTARKTGR